MKVLAVCRGGNSRSVAMAYVLKQEYKLDALSCGWRENTAETLKMLYQWADVIVTMTTYIETKIPEEFKSKVIIADVGSDVWKRPDRGLRALCIELWEASKKEATQL